MRFVLLLLTVFGNTKLSFCTVCKSEFEETICENFRSSPEIVLNSGTDKLIIKNATGVISLENLSFLETVVELTITESELTDLKPGALCSIPNLNSITIYNNKKFPKISKNLLKNCRNLKKIYADGPGIIVESGAFAETGDLHTLTLNDSILPDIIDKTSFQGLNSVKSLTIQNSKFRKLNEDAFENLKKLKFLDLQGNGIEEIEPETFRGLVELRVLNLGDNKLKNLTWDEFKDLKSLKVLFLERNEFNSVDVEKLVKNVPELERIFLSYDKLSPTDRKKIDDTLSKFKINVVYAGVP